MSTIPQRRSRTQEYDLEEDDAYYVQRQPTSAVRYTQPRQQVIQRGEQTDYHTQRAAAKTEPAAETVPMLVFTQVRHFSPITATLSQLLLSFTT